MVGPDPRHRPARRSAPGSVDPGAWSPCRAPASGPAPCRSTARRRAGRAVPAVVRHPGGTPLPAGRSPDRWPGYAPMAAVRWIRHSGGAPSTSGADPIGHILHLERDEPDVAGAARWYLEPVDYLSMRFTGRAAATPASMAGAWLTDNRRRRTVWPTTRCWCGPAACRRASSRRCGRRRAWSGPCCPAVAADLGLPDGVVVVAGTPDLHSACVGSGAVPRTAAPRGRLHHQLGQLPVPEEEDRRRPPDGHGARASCPACAWWPTTRSPAGGRSSGSGTCLGAATRRPASSRRSTS